MEIGDKILCKSENILYFKKGKRYEIVGNGHIGTPRPNHSGYIAENYFIINSEKNLKTKLRKYEISKYFYTKQEERELKIKRIRRKLRLNGI